MSIQELYDREQKSEDIEEQGLEILPTWFLLAREIDE